MIGWKPLPELARWRLSKTLDMKIDKEQGQYLNGQWNSKLLTEMHVVTRESFEQ